MKKNIQKLTFGLMLVLAGTLSAKAQQVSQKIGNNPTIITPEAALEIESTNKGLLLPRVALTGTSSPAPLASHVAGMEVYNTATTADVIPGVYFNDGTKWVSMTGGVTTEVDGIVGNEVTDVVANKGLTRSGAGTTADPYKVAMSDGTAVGQVMKWNGSTWAPAADAGVATEVDGIIGNEVTDVVANKGLTRSGAGTTADPYKVAMTDGTAVGQVMKWDGSTWAPAADAGVTTEVDGIIGNEVTDATTNGGLVRAGAGTAASPYTLGLPLTGNTTGDLITWNGTAWVPLANTSWKTTGNAGTVATTNFIGTTDAIDFVTRTNNTEKMRVTSAGNVGIGTNNPTSKLEVDGAATNKTALNAAAGTTINFALSNLAYTTANPGAITLQNMKDGGTYTLAVRGTTSGTASFSHTGLTFKSVNNGATTAGKETMYTFIVMGTTAYFFMNTGF